MSMQAMRTHLFARQPLSALGKLTIWGLLGGGLATGIIALALAIFVSLRQDVLGLIMSVCLLVGAGLVATGIRWMSLVGFLLSLGFFYKGILTEPFAIQHLTNAKALPGGFVPFVLDGIITGFLLVGFGAGIGAAVQNYRKVSRQAPGWLPSAVSLDAGMVIGAILIGAIAQPPASAGTTYTNGMPTVHMNAGNFDQPSVTIPKGSKLLLVDDGSSLHVLANGRWENGLAKPEREPGAPTVNNVQVSGNSVEIGPFTIAGTYHLYCTVHQGMNLTIIVQ
jgi:plastocyanin